MPRTTFSSLPADILISILTSLSSTLSTPHTLTSCALVSHAWNKHTTPLLYTLIALRPAAIPLFCACLRISSSSSNHGLLIRSLTVSVQVYDDLAEVGELTRVLPGLEGLRCFSVWCERGCAREVERRVLGALVAALPGGVRGLEVDCGGCDGDGGDEVVGVAGGVVSEEGQREGGERHLCHILRAILPQLHHLRLRIRVCEALFAPPLTLPHLRTLLVSCTRTRAIDILTCHSATPLWPLVTSSLLTLLSPSPSSSATASPSIPPTASLHAFTSSPLFHTHLSIWQAFHLANLRTQTTSAMPTRAVWVEAMIRGSTVLRLPSGAEVMSTPGGIERVAEGRMWVEGITGSRVPVGILEGRGEKAGRGRLRRGK